MKKKLLLFLLFHLLFGFTLSSKNLKNLVKLHDVNFELSSKLISPDTIKKNKKASRVSKTKAVLSPPSTTAGSSCGDGVSLVQVNVYAFGANSSETIEWFTSQTSVTPIYTGTVYSPSISSTRTFYVRSRSGSDISTRVPVVASIYLAPPIVTLTASPANNISSPLCLGTPITFTASGGADLFEFSVDGVVKQGMSDSRVFTTDALTDGQVVKVRTRYAVTKDGSIAETSWGTGALEDNFLSAPLSANASTAYVNSLKISALEDKVVLGIAGKVLNNRSILLFLDTKSGGFNVSNYGDEADGDPLVRAFNIFNNNPSTFDSYFQADYCLVISTDAAETNYYANVIELRTGASVKTYLGSAATGFPSAVMGVNKNNSGISDYSLGFEVEVLKSLIGYTTGDIKFFALTMNDKEDGSQSVTNSFLSPERSSNLDYGIGAIDYNIKDPNPVVVASAALTPCYSEANITMNFVSIPTTASITQPTCALQTGTILITTQPGVEYSINGTVYQDSNSFSGLVPGNYTLYVRNKLDNTCVLSSVTPAVINAIPTPPLVPTTVSVVQPTCGTPSGSIAITTQTGVEYSLDGIIYQASNTFSGLAPGTYPLYVRNTADTTCVTSSGSSITINAIPTPPVVPTTASVVQPTCGIPSGSIVITTQTGVEYSLDGTSYQASNTFTGLAPGNYTLYVRNTADITCVTSSGSSTTIDAIPIPPVVPTTASVIQPTCGTPSGSIAITTQTGVEYSLNGTVYQASNTFSGLAPGDYTLYVRNTVDTTCITPSGSVITINAIPNPPVVPTTASVVQPTCATPSGSISITTQTGVEYSLDGVTYQASNVFSGLAPSTTYDLYVRNIADNTCITSSGSVTTINAIPNPPVVPTSASVTQPTCGTPSGNITITVQSGVEYSLDGMSYQSSNAFSGLAPGNYTLYVRNTADITCVTSSGSSTTINAIPTPPVVPTTASVTQPTCGTPSGSIAITTQTGVEYSLNGTSYQVSNTFTGLAPGSYTLYVRNTADTSCITPSGSAITINAIPTPPVVPTTTSVVQPTCGIPSGTIIITAQTGVEYSLNGTTYQTSNTFSGLTPGSYPLYVRNIADTTCVTFSGSSTTINAIPTPPVVPTSASVTQPTCGTPSGSITIVAQSGVAYSLDGINYQASNAFSELAPGNYTLYVRNTADITCVTSSGSSTTINAIPTPPVVPTTASVTQPTCGTPSGSISITIQTGVEYSLNGISYQASNTFTGLAQGAYTLYVRSTTDNTCVTPSASAITINAIPTPPVVPTTTSVVQPTCGKPSGSIAITTQTGVEYSLDGITYQASNTFSALAPGIYPLYVRNIADTTCVTASGSSTTINSVPTPPVAPTSASVVQPTCGMPSGTIVITAQTGVEYSLNGTSYQASNTFTGLAPGDYTLYVRNIADITCVTSSGSSTTINAIPTAPIVPTSVSVTQPTCGTPSGSISITTQTGVEYSLNGTSYQASNSFNGLTPGAYTLYVRNIADTSCVTPSGSAITINAIPTPPVVPTTASVVQPTCAVPSGSIVITTQTGVEYSLDGTTYQASNTFAGLAPGSYMLYVRNTADITCITSSSSATTINSVPTPPVVPTTASVAQPTCGTPSGSIAITVQSGVEYSLNGTTYQTSNLFTGLAPGTTYTLYVRSLSDATCVASSASTTIINAIQVVLVPTVVSTVQPTCAVQSGSIVITTQPGVAYSLNGITYQASNTFAGLAPGNYTLYVRSTVDNSCLNTSTSPITINAIPTPPVVPTMTSIVQPTCSVTSGTIVIAAQSGVEYSLNGTTYQASNTFAGLAPNNYILYVRNIADNTCSVQSMASVTVNPLPLLPSTPTLVQVVQPTCLVPSGSITISTQANVQYSIGNGYQNSNVFNNLAPGKYSMSVRFTSSIACITLGSEITINAIPPQIQFETIGDCENKEYILTANPLSGSYDTNNVSYQWKDNTGAPIGTNSNVLNVTDVIASTPSGQVAFPVTYTLTVTSTNTGCETSNNVVIESAYCNIQKGISPDGNGSNDFFDLRLMGVKKLEIFNRYGIKVYNQSDYTDQWKGQSNKGEDLPSATYYYVIEFNSGELKTGWIYLIREKQ